MLQQYDMTLRNHHLVTFPYIFTIEFVAVEPMISSGLYTIVTSRYDKLEYST